MLGELDYKRCYHSKDIRKSNKRLSVNEKLQRASFQNESTNQILRKNSIDYENPKLKGEYPELFHS